MISSRLLLLGTLFGLASALAQNAPETTTNIQSDGPGEMVSTDKETTITFRDKVVVTGTNLRLTCDYLKVVVLRTGDPAATLGKVEKFRSLLATGNVVIVQGDREAACGRAEVLPEDDKIILTENPVVVDRAAQTRLIGERITMFRGERRVLVDKPSVTGPPIRDLGFDKDKPAPPAETPKSN